MFDEDDSAENLDSTVFMYLLYYQGSHYMAELVEVTKDTAYFQVDANLVRKGIFQKNRLDMRWFEELGIKLCPVHHAPLLEQ